MLLSLGFCVVVSVFSLYPVGHVSSFPTVFVLVESVVETHVFVSVTTCDFLPIVIVTLSLFLTVAPFGRV